MEFRDDNWLKARKKLFRDHVRPFLRNELKIKHAAKLEPIFLGDIRPEQYCNGDPIFDTWMYDNIPRGSGGISRIAFQLMPFSSFEERLEYFSRDVIGGLKSYGHSVPWPSVYPNSDNVMLGWSVEEEDEWFECLYGDLLSERPFFDFWGSSGRWVMDVCSIWMKSLEAYFSNNAWRLPFEPHLVRDGAFSNRRLDLFFGFLSLLRSTAFLLRPPRREDYSSDDDALVELMMNRDWHIQAQLRKLCILSIDYEDGFRHMTRSTYKDYKPYFDSISNIDFKKVVLGEIRQEFSSNPLLFPLYDAAVKAKDWSELHRMWRLPVDDS